MIRFTHLIPSFGKKIENNNLGNNSPEKSRRPEQNKLERSPATDTLQIKNTPRPLKTNEIKETRKTRNNAKINKQAAKDLDFVTKEKLLTKELLYFLQPKIDAKGNKTFTPAQINIIGLAAEKLKFFDTISTELANEADKYGDIVLNDLKEVFGGEEGLGKYLTLRKKDKTSIYNKLVKSFKNERIKSEVHNLFAKKVHNCRYSHLDKLEKEILAMLIDGGEVKLDSKDYKIIENAFKSDPKDYYAKTMFNTVYDKLNKQDKNTVKEKVFQENGKCAIAATSKQARYEAISYVKDLIGIRLVLPTGNRNEMAKVEKYIEKAILNEKINMTRMSNYHANHILPYIRVDKARYWKELTGMELIENSEVRKKNGYTTTQINLEHKIPNKNRPVLVELQIRTDALNKIGNIEHLIYDIIEKKNIHKNIPELKEYYDSIGIEEAVNKVFNDSKKEQKYVDYERAYYSYIRNQETNNPHVKLEKPLLAQFGLGEYEHLLSFDALEIIDDKAKAIKRVFEKKAK